MLGGRPGSRPNWSASRATEQFKLPARQHCPCPVHSGAGEALEPEPVSLAVRLSGALILERDEAASMPPLGQQRPLRG